MICEKALAHTIGNKTSRAYLRDDMLEQRRPLMTAWATRCAKEPAKVRHCRRPAEHWAAERTNRPREVLDVLAGI